MSFYTYYQAIPERSRLLERLGRAERFCRLYTWLIPHGPGPFHLDEFDPEELDEILNHLAGGELLGSRAELDGCLGDIAAEIAETVMAYPGLGERAAYIEKQHREIEGPLAQELVRRGSEAGAKLMTELLYGGDALAPGLFDRYDSQLRLVPARTVGEGAKLLAGLELTEEDHGISDYACEQYGEWKSLIMAAAELSEALMVFPTG